MIESNVDSVISFAIVHPFVAEYKQLYRLWYVYVYSYPKGLSDIARMVNGMGFEVTAHKYAAKTRFELDRLAQQGVQVVGNAYSPVLLVKGVPNQGEAKGRAVLSGEDGKALRAALAKLGYAPEEWCGMACWDVSGTPLSPDVLGLALATLDPATIIACDDVAVASICSALLGDLFTLEEGRVTILRGMRVLTLGGFEAALASPQSKQVMWARLKQVPPLAEPY